MRWHKDRGTGRRPQWCAGAVWGAAASSKLRGVILLAGLAAPTSAWASENGGSAYSHGAEGWLTGIIPPPGDYLIGYTNHYSTRRLNDGNGKSSVPNFRVEALSQTLRYVHVTDVKVLGGSLAFQLVVPLVDLKVRAGSNSDHEAGFGDILVTPIMIGWHKGKWHYGLSLGAVLPTGRYQRGALANIGRNYLTWEAVAALTYLDPDGPEFSVKLIYHAPRTNNATRYRSGDEVHADFAAGWNFGKLGVGLGGYYSRQLEDDRQGGAVVGDGRRGKLFAFGPTVKYQAGKVAMMVTWHHETEAKYKSQGDKLWLKVVLPLQRK